MKLGLGMIGCGRMAHELAVVIRDSVPEAKLVAGFDPFSGSREVFCAEFGAAGERTGSTAAARGRQTAAGRLESSERRCWAKIAFLDCRGPSNAGTGF